MFENEFTMPISLLKTEALLGRIVKDHLKRPIIEEKARILRSGYNGEKNLNYFLSLIPEQNYHIFHNLRLPANSSHFQIDFLLFSSKIIIILDGKNHSGTLTFEKNQLIQHFDDMEKIYENPISQIYRHRTLLKNWLKKNQISSIPIEYYVVITNQSTKIIISSKYLEGEERVCKSSNLLRVIESLEKKHTQDILDPKKQTKLKKLILQNHTPESLDILKKYGINVTEIIPGVICPKCLEVPMQYSRNKWCCTTCQHISNDAHIQAIYDYFLLIKPTANISELQKFLNLPSTRITRTLISKLNLPHSGKNKGRIYYQK